MDFSLSLTEKLSIDLSGALVWSRASKLATACIDTLSGVDCLGDGSGAAHWRTFSDVTLGLSYENTRLILGFSLQTDALYTHVKDKRNKRESPTPLAKRSPLPS